MNNNSSQTSLIRLFFTLFVLLAWSCTKDEGTSIPLKAIHAKQNDLQLVVGASLQINATPDPANADSREMPFGWESSNTRVASVSSSGLVNALSAGTTEITVSARVSSNIYKKIPVTVSGDNIPLTGISVTPSKLTIEVGKSTRLMAKAEPENVTGVSFTWESEDNSVATVSDNGLVTGIAKGHTSITVKSGNIEEKIPITVTHTLSVIIGNTTYSIDTLNYEVLREGIHWLKFSIPEFVNGFGTLGKGLVVNTVEINLTYPENNIEVHPAALIRRDNRETPSQAYKRVAEEYASSGRKPIVAINGDFFLLDNNNLTGYAYVNRRPHGMEVSNGKVVQTPFTDRYNSTHNKGLVIRDNNLPEYAENITFSGRVDIGTETYKLSEVNGFANAGEMVFFNNEANSYANDSAFAWSPYTSTMVSLSYPKDGWQVNNRMEFTVTAIDYDVETTVPAATPYNGKSFNGQGAILVGNPTSPTMNNASKLFLSKMKVGDKIGITMEIGINNNKVSDKKLNIIGTDSRGAMLINGNLVNTWNEAHPRTAVGYSKDRDKMYLVVIDGRQSNFSTGATTGQVASILKALGAHNGINLDGGGSSAMIVNGNIANKPSDGSERSVANSIMVITNK